MRISSATASSPRTPTASPVSRQFRPSAPAACPNDRFAPGTADLHRGELLKDCRQHRLVSRPRRSPASGRAAGATRQAHGTTPPQAGSSSPSSAASILTSMTFGRRRVVRQAAQAASTPSAGLAASHAPPTSPGGPGATYSAVPTWLPGSCGSSPRPIAWPPRESCFARRPLCASRCPCRLISAAGR